MARKKSFDLRELPVTMDPHKFYEYRVLERANQATGVEALLYRILPYSMIRSFAFAIDPFSKLKTESLPVTTPNRRRRRVRVSVMDTIRSRGRYDDTNQSSIRRPDGYWNGLGPAKVTSIDNPAPFIAGKQDPLWEYSSDTTASTRKIGSPYGEFELFRISVSAPSRYLQNTFRADIAAGHAQPVPPAAPYVWNKHWYKQTYETYPSAATYPRIRAESLRTTEILRAESLMTQHALSMYKSVSPFSRSYSLARNLVELRDVPRTIFDLRKLVLDYTLLQKSIFRGDGSFWDFRRLPKDISDQYLAYVFGWRQLYSDIMGLMGQPEKIASRFNYLLQRSGKPTSYSSKKSLTFSTTDVPGLDLIAPRYNYRVFPQGTTTLINVDLRMVLNCTFDFPRADIPKFREEFFSRKLGTSLTPTDIYNLVPWTWLFDWFTGLGDYVDVIDQSRSDPTYINYGFLTSKTSGTIASGWRLEATNYDSLRIEGVYIYNNVTKQSYYYNANADYHCHVRRDLSRVMDVQTLSDPSSLSERQQTILGALIAQRSKFR